MVIFEVTERIQPYPDLTSVQASIAVATGQAVLPPPERFPQLAQLLQMCMKFKAEVS